MLRIYRLPCCSCTALLLLLGALGYTMLWRGHLTLSQGQGPITVPPARPGSRAAAPPSWTPAHEIEARMKGPLQPADAELLFVIRERFLLPPSTLPYRLRYKKGMRNPYLSGQIIKSILHDFFATKKDGFFVEAGALDGEYMSHTLNLEREQGWRGLLVEPDEHNFADLKERHRKAWISPTCFSTHDYPETVILTRLLDPDERSKKLSKGKYSIVKTGDLESSGAVFESRLSAGQCVPARSLLAALNITHVDVFVLDVETAERDVLANFPFEKITVDLWAIEHMNSHEDTEFIAFMQQNDYYYFDALCYEVADYIFVRKSSALFQMLQVPINQENRTNVCSFKIEQIRSELNGTTAVLKFRDSHHYPGLKYKGAPNDGSLPNSTSLLTGTENMILVDV